MKNLKFFLGLTAITFVFIQPSFAGRKVSFPVEGALNLTNTSKQTVTYNITCKDKNGTTITPLTATNQTVAIGAKVSVVNSSGENLCAAGFDEFAIGGGASPQMKRCHNSGGVAFASINNFCGSLAHVCSLEEVNQFKGATNTSYESGAFVSSGDWSQYDGASWTNYSGNSTNYANTKFNSSSTYLYSNGHNGSGDVTFNDDGWVSTTATNLYDALCCSLYSDISQCEVEIISDGHLSTPSFNGGKPF